MNFHKIKRVCERKKTRANPKSVLIKEHINPQNKNIKQKKVVLRVYFHLHPSSKIKILNGVPNLLEKFFINEVQLLAIPINLILSLLANIVCNKQN